MCEQLTLNKWAENKMLWAAIINLTWANKEGTISPDIMNPDEMDLFMRLNYGDRIMFNPLATVDVAGLAKHINSLYYDKWIKLIKFHTQSNNLGADNTHRINENIEQSGNVIDTGNSTNTVSAYNSDALINDTGTTNSNNSDTKNESIRELVDETFSLKSAYNALPLMDKTNIITSMVKDVVNYLTLSVY